MDLNPPVIATMLALIFGGCGGQASEPSEDPPTHEPPGVPVEAPRTPSPEVTQPAPALPSWPAPTARPDVTACETLADCVFTNANQTACCVAQEGAVYAEDFVNWRRSWMLANCPASDCVDVLQEPAGSCAREVRCREGRCSDACGD